MAAFEFFNKRCRDQQNDESNEKLHVEKRRNLSRFSIGFIECLDCAVLVHSVFHDCSLQRPTARATATGTP